MSARHRRGGGEHFQVVNSIAGDHCGLSICMYPWPCPGALREWIATALAEHTADDGSTVCRTCYQTMPCKTRIALNGGTVALETSRP